MHNDRLPGKVHIALFAHAVAHCDEHLVLHRLHPYLPLEHFHRLGLGVRRRDYHELRAHERAGADALRQVPVIAYDDADPAKRRIEHLEAVVRGSVIVLLIELLRLRDVHHLGAVKQLAVGVYPQ